MSNHPIIGRQDRIKRQRHRTKTPLLELSVALVKLALTIGIKLNPDKLIQQITHLLIRKNIGLHPPAFSTAFALPFFFLSLFPQGLSALPQSGGWLNSVKVVMGFLELAAGMKFLSNVDLVWGWGVISREVFIAFWIAIFVMCGIYLLGKIRLPHDSPLESVGPLRLMSSMGCLAFSFYLLTGLFGAPLGEWDAFFPPYGSQGAIAQIRGGRN